MKHVLVTGGRGYVGKKFIDFALQDLTDFNITSIVRNNNHIKVENFTEIHADIRDHNKYIEPLMKAEYVIWFAAARDHFLDYPTLHDINVKPVSIVLEYLKKSNNIKKFIYISSISAIDNDFFSRSPISDTSQAKPKTAYGQSKLAAENCIRESKVTYSILRLPFMYGSNYAKYGHLWLWLYLNKVFTSNRWHFNGRVSLLHINDLSKILIDIIQEEICIGVNTTLILGDGCIYKINDILDSVRQINSRKQLHPRLWDTSVFFQKICALNITNSTSYWSRLLFDDNYFLSIPSNYESLTNFRYISLADGLRESYTLSIKN